MKEHAKLGAWNPWAVAYISPSLFPAYDGIGKAKSTFQVALAT